MLRAAVISLTLATPAIADCPEAADMDRGGVRFSATDGDTETFRRYADGSIESTVDGGEAARTRAVLAKGLYLTRIFDMDEDGGISNDVRYSYPTPLDNLPEPFPGGRLTLTVEGTDADGSFDSRETYAFGQASVLFLGGCSFVMIPVELLYDGVGTRDLYHYLPDFGLSYLAASYDADGSETDYSFYSVMGIK